MENITFKLSNSHEHGSVFFDYLALRKRFFVDLLGWDIPHDDDVEMDQYDNPLAHYSVVCHQGRVIGGARTMPTSSHWGQHTYMLRDAVDGKLGTIPRDVMPSVIASPEVWECTRLVVSDDLRSLQERGRCLGLIVDGLADTARANGARKLISLSPPSLARSLRQLGYDAQQIGDSYRGDEGRRRYAVLSMPSEKIRETIAA